MNISEYNANKPVFIGNIEIAAGSHFLENYTADDGESIIKCYVPQRKRNKISKT